MTTAALWALLAYLTLGERVSLGRVPGFPGLPVLEILFVGMAVLAWVGAGRPRPGVRVGWVATVGPLLLLLLVLPLVGVLLGIYGVTSLYSWMVVLVPLAGLALAVTARERLLPYCTAAIIAHGGYALGQMLYRLGLLPTAVWGPLRQWDVEVQRSLTEAYVIVGRSTGFFVNANTFSLWGVVAVVFAYCYLTGATRAVALGLAVVGVLSSQSRTGLVCLTVLFVAWAVHAMRNSAVLGRATLRGVVFVLPALLLLYALGIPQRVLETALGNRLLSILAVLGGGARVDANLSGRVDAWRLALAYSPTDPRLSFGTLGPPQVWLRDSIDNQFVALFVQGGVLMVAAYVVALLSPLALRRRGVTGVGPLSLVCVVVGVASLTMVPLFTVQASTLGWLVAGLTVAGVRALGLREDRRITVRGPVGDGSGVVVARQTP